jgi:ATP-dependent helicase HrpB
LDRSSPLASLAGQLAPDRFALLKVIVATNIAETSLTIDGVRIVVDSGLERRNRFDPATGMSRLETVRISRTGNSNHLPVPRLFA